MESPLTVRQMLDGDNGLFASQGLQQLMRVKTEKRKKNCGRSCFTCRQLRVKCDYQRPCRNCVTRGESCKTDDEKASCAQCRKSKLKCDKQKPCSRCVKMGNADQCVSQIQNGVPEKFRHTSVADISAAGAWQGVGLEKGGSAASTWHGVGFQNWFPTASLSASPHITSAAGAWQGVGLERGFPMPSSSASSHITSAGAGQSVGLENGSSAAGTWHGVGLENGFPMPSSSASPHIMSESSMVVTASSETISESGCYGVEQHVSQKRAFVEIYDGEAEAEAEAEQQGLEVDKVVRVMRPAMNEPKKLRLLDTSTSRHEMSLSFTNKICKHPAMQKMWEAGYNKVYLEQLFSIIPHSFQGLIFQALRALGTLASTKAHVARLQAGSSSSRGLNPASVGWDDDFMPAPEMVVNEVYDDLGCGWWSLSFDPVTGRRTSLEVNMVLAKMLSVHPEELLARGGHSDVGLPCSQLEFLCSVLHDLCNAGERRLICYSTVTVQRHGRVQETLLVRRESFRDFSDDGKCVRIQHLLTRVSEEEYDNAFRSDPSMCRPFYSLLDDFRSGAEIVADASRDLLFDEQIGSMMQTEEGVKKLRRLEACVRIRFEPILQAAEAMMQVSC